MKIRPPTLSESYEVAGLMDRGLHGVDIAYDRLVRNWPRRLLARHVSLPIYFHYLNEGWIIEIEGEIVAWLYLLYHDRSVHINDIGVTPAYRRRGYGRELLAWAEHRARERERAVLTLAVTVDNEPAVRLYERSGFRALHHLLWEGTRSALPHGGALPLKLRELEPFQRSAPFHRYWGRALEADGHPVEPLLADQAGTRHSPRGRAWELWQGKESAGYADYVNGVLRLLPGEPRRLDLLQAAWDRLRPHLAGDPLRLDLGSDVAAEVAAPHLEAAGWRRTRRERMVMVKAVA